MGVWYAPKGMPKPIIDKLSAALQKALQDPDVQERLAQSGAETVPAERAMPEVLRDHQEGRRVGAVSSQAGAR